MEEKTALYRYLAPMILEERLKLFEEVLDRADRHFTVAVEDVYKERNASALIRTCDCVGIQDFHIIEKSHEYKISRGISQGAKKWLNIHRYKELEDNALACIRQLRDKGYRIVATTPNKNDLLLQDFDLGEKAAFFFGMEKEGLSESVLREADVFLKIPTYGFTNSYNVSVSAAIILYDLMRKLRQSSDIAWQLTEAERLDIQLKWMQDNIRHGPRVVEAFYQRRKSKP